MLDPLIMASIGFLRRIRRCEVDIRSVEGQTVTIPAFCTFKHRGGNIGTWYIDSIFSIPSNMQISTITFKIYTESGRIITVTISAVIVLFKGTYRLMYVSCVRSTDPIMLTIQYG